MTISFPLSLPTTPGIRRCTFRARTVVGMSASPFTGSQQVYKWPGGWWEAEIELPPMKRAQAEEWIGTQLSLNGPYGTFLMGDPDGKLPRGVATGTPVVSGTHSAQTQTPVTSGWTVSTAGIVKRGDYLQIGSGTLTRLHKALTDGTSGTSGLCTLDIFPPLREALGSGTPIKTGTCVGNFRLSSNTTQWDANEMSVYGISFSCVEAF